MEARVADLERKVNIMADCLKLLTQLTDTHQEVLETDGKILKRLDKRVSSLEVDHAVWGK